MISKRLSGLLSLLSIISLTACTGSGSGGTPRTAAATNLEAYGQLRGATVADKESYTVEFLQSNLTPSFGFKGDGTGVCGSLYASESQDFKLNWLAWLTCNKNIEVTQQEVENDTENSIDLKKFVRNNAAVVASTKFYRIIYNTPGAPYIFSGGATTPQDVSALMIVPRDKNGVALAQDKIKGVILYYHPTVFSKAGVPSGFDAPESSVERENYTLYTDFMLAAIYASQGYVVVAPDYVGQGVNKNVMHPYVAFAETNAQSGIYALKAARLALSKENIKLPVKANLFITSYSEGGAYALWASKLIQGEYKSVLDNSGYVLKRTAGISGAYDVSGSMLDYMYANVTNDWDPKLNTWNISPGIFESGTALIESKYYGQIRAVAAFEAAGSKVGLSAYMLTAMVHYNTTSAAYDTLVHKNFVNQSQCLNIPKYAQESVTHPNNSFTACPSTYTLPTLFNNSTLNPREIFSQALAAAGTTGFITRGQDFNTVFEGLQNGLAHNSVSTFMHKDIRDDAIVMSRVIPNNIFDWTTNSPIELIYTKYDSVLPNKNSLKACGKIPGVPNVKDRSAPGLVNCIQVDNTKLLQQTVIAGLPMRVPMFADHSWIEPTLQIIALSRFQAAESTAQMNVAMQ